LPETRTRGGEGRITKRPKLKLEMRGETVKKKIRERRRENKRREGNGGKRVGRSSDQIKNLINGEGGREAGLNKKGGRMAGIASGSRGTRINKGEGGRRKEEKQAQTRGC
jgi:hypothetical protein